MVVHDSFREHIETLDPAYRRLMAMSPVTVVTLPSQIPQQAVYLFSEGDRHLYVGRTNRLGRRLQQHWGGGHNSAPFAFLLARQATGILTATYRTQGSRAELELDPEFAAVFLAQKQRVRTMNIRFVEEENQVRQALLEIYVAVALGTPHNKWDTH